MFSLSSSQYLNHLFFRFHNPWIYPRHLPVQINLKSMSAAATSSSSFCCLDGIRSIAESGISKVGITLKRFRLVLDDVFVAVILQVWLLDQFGVLHDGKQPYPGAIFACMLTSLLIHDFSGMF